MFLISLTGHSLKGHLEADLEPASAFCRIALREYFQGTLSLFYWLL